MSGNFSRKLAGRYLNPVRSHVSAITLISMVGVMLGVAVLIVVLSVHAGFEREVKRLLLGFAPHVEVQDLRGPVRDWNELGEKLAEVKGVEGSYAIIQNYVLADTVESRSPILFRAIDTEDEGQIAALDELLVKDEFPGSRADMGLDEYAVVSRQLALSLGLDVGDEVEVYASSNFDEVQAAFERTEEEPLKERFEEVLRASLKEAKSLSGLREVPEADWNAFYVPLANLYEEDMRPGERELLEEVYEALDDELRVPKDEERKVFVPEQAIWKEVQGALTRILELDVEAEDAEVLKNLKEIVLPKKLKVWGVYGDTKRTQGPQMFIPLPVGRELTGLDGAQVVAVRLEDPYLAYQAGERIQGALGDMFYVSTWMDRHQAQFSLIRTERMMMTFALSFIGLISAFSIMAVMYTVTIQKKQEIGVMKALGATGEQISWVFLWQGLVVGFFGALGGVGLALLVIWNRAEIQAMLARVGMDPFPADFQGFSVIPAEIMPGYMAAIAFVAWLLCGLAALVPALVAANHDAAKSLRNL
ncbi:MAG: FtsX-like permease family protein [Verrucomicrobiota bacterium]